MTDYNLRQEAEDIDGNAMLEETTTPKRRSSLTIHKIPEDEDKKHLRKRVTFVIDHNQCIGNDGNGCCSNDDTDDDSTGHPPLQLTDKLCHDLWYSPKEIGDMKLTAKRVLLNPNDANADELVGLERFTAQRATWKRSAIHYVLAAQRQNKGEEFIRRVSQRCSGWARETAFHQGFKDYCAVNDPLASLFGDEEENYNESFFSDVVEKNNITKNKRKASDINTNNGDSDEFLSCLTTPTRNVRQRSVKVEDEDSESNQPDEIRI